MRTTGAFATFALAAALVVAISGCRNDGHDEHQHPTTEPATGTDGATASAQTTADQASAGTPVNKMCAIEQEHPIDPAVTYAHDGKVYGFCCEDCIDAFKKDPAKYANAK
jgi:YHS domain-containing protein